VSYDAFVGYAPPDLPEAERLAHRLVTAGLRVFLLEWTRPGDVETEAKERALLAATNGLLLFSRATMADPAIRDDYAALLLRVHTGGRRFVPVPVDDVELPPFAAIRRPVRLGSLPPDEYDRRVATLVDALRPSGPESTNEAGYRLGFGVDLVGYGARSAPEKEQAQRRLRGLLTGVLGDLGVAQDETDTQVSGDGVLAFLPARVPVPVALPALLRSWCQRLAADNARYADRMRLRMAVAVGPVGWSELGFTGGTVVELGRLLDCGPLRTAIDEHPGDLAVLVSDALFTPVVRQRYPGLDPDRFTPCAIRVKEYAAQAWLWTPDPVMPA
jgi:hypothetical protein